MSTHPNSNSKVVLYFILAVGLILVLQAVRRNRGPGAGPGARPSSPNAVVPSRNPIQQMLLAAPDAEPRQGTAVAVLVDVSGSMARPVAGGDGRSQPKIEIARDSLIRLLRQIDGFVRAHPDRPVHVGIYEFSARGREPSCRPVVPLGPPELATLETAVRGMVPGGDTPIGDALVYAKQQLDASGLTQQHILVITDGENNRGYAPGDVVHVLSTLPDARRASVYCIAFDIAADRFRAVRDAGGLVLGAVNEGELQQTMDYVLTGKILAEQPEVPKAQ